MKMDNEGLGAGRGTVDADSAALPDLADVKRGRTPSGTWELVPTDGRKSFGGKAKVLTYGDVHVLRSYDTDVAWARPAWQGGSLAILDRGWSRTTMRHIKAFVESEGFDTGTGKWMLRKYGRNG